MKLHNYLKKSAEIITKTWIIMLGILVIIGIAGALYNLLMKFIG